MFKIKLAFLAVMAMFLLVQPASATVLYSSGVAWDGTTGQYGISGTGAYVTDAFTLLSQSTITSVDLGLWDAFGGNGTNGYITYEPSSLNYKIQNASGVDVSSGNVSLNTLDSKMYGSGFWMFKSEFLLNVALPAGTYYLTLSNGAATNGEAIGWSFNQNDTSIVAWTYPHAPFNSQLSAANIPAESFIINGKTDSGPTQTPEPATLLLVGLGLLGLGGFRKKLFKK